MRFQYLISFFAVTLLIFLSKQAGSQEPLELKAIEGSHSVGFDQNNLGIRSFKRKQFNTALKHFHIASMADPKRGEIYFNIALTLVKLGEDNEATKYFYLANKHAKNNTQVTNSKFHKLYNCKLNKEIRCDFTPPKPFKIEGSGTHYLE